MFFAEKGFLSKKIRHQDPGQRVLAHHVFENVLQFRQHVGQHSDQSTMSVVAGIAFGPNGPSCVKVEHTVLDCVPLFFVCWKGLSHTHLVQSCTQQKMFLCVDQRQHQKGWEDGNNKDSQKRWQIHRLTYEECCVVFCPPSTHCQCWLLHVCNNGAPEANRTQKN